MATLRPSLVSRASYTSPIPPHQFARGFRRALVLCRSSMRSARQKLHEHAVPLLVRGDERLHLTPQRWLRAGLSKSEFPISTLSPRETVHPPPSRVNFESPWPRLGGKRGSSSSSAGRPGLFLASDSARRWHFSPPDDSSTLSSLSLLVRYPFGTGNAAILLSMLPKRCRVRCPSASSSQ